MPRANKFDDLLAQVHPHTDVPSSVVSALTGIAQMFEEKKDDPAAIQALCDDLRDGKDAFGSHICANTVVMPAPTHDRRTPEERELERQGGRVGPDRIKEAEGSVPTPHKSPALGSGEEMKGPEDSGKHGHAKKH